MQTPARSLHHDTDQKPNLPLLHSRPKAFQSPRTLFSSLDFSEAKQQTHHMHRRRLINCSTLEQRGREREKSTMPHLLPLFLLFQASLLAAQPTRRHPEPASLQLVPAAAAASPTTIPAFPEQSDVSTAACPLDPPTDLLPYVSAACARSDGGLPSRSRCCPALSAWLLTAYAATALAARSLPSAAGLALPALPDDSESCIGGVERALRHRGVELPRVNATCDAAYCFCGVRLRRLTCAGAFVANVKEGRWEPAGDARRRLVKDCSRPGFAGCTRCLRSLNQLKAKEKQSTRNATRTDKDDAATRGKECQLMGVTWLLSKNRTIFYPVSTSVLQAIMTTDTAAVGASGMTSCLLSPDDIPLPVGSNQINDSNDGSFTVQLTSSILRLVSLALLFVLIH